jgi:hypothetical protein
VSGRTLHPRYLTTQKARVDLDTALLRIIEEHELTFAEVWLITAETSARWAAIDVRDEREGDDTPPKEGT